MGRFQRRQEAPKQRPEPGAVTALREKSRRAGRYEVEIGGVAVAPVSVEMVSEWRLAVGTALDARQLDGLLAAARQVECHDRALGALARRSRSTRDLERWLGERGYSPAEVAATTERLTELGLLDDLEFARVFAHARAVGRGFGLRRVAAELGRHGVASKLIETVLGELRERPGGDEQEALEAAARRRARALQSLDPEVARRRLLGWLIRRGFSPSDAARAVKGIFPAS